MNYYHQRKISNSLLKKAAVSLERFKYEWDTIDKEQEQTAAMVFGNVYHTLTLEPQEFTKRYFINPYDGRTKEGKEAKAQAEALKLQTISIDQRDTALAMVKALTSSDYVAPDLVAKMKFIFSITDLEIEKEICWIDPETGLECKAKLDAYSKTHNLVIDLKSIEKLEDYKIDSNFGQYRYDIASAQYSEAIKQERGDDLFPTFLFITQEKQEPYLFRLFSPTPEMLSQGLSKRKELMQKLKEAFETGEFYSHKEIEQINMPAWSNK